MPDKRSGSIHELLPESFYDLLAYVVPSALFVVAILGSLEPEKVKTWIAHCTLDSTVYEILIGFFIFGALYLSGQVATSFSYFVVALPVRWVLRLFMPSFKDRNFGLLERWFAVRKTCVPGVRSEMSKRLARWVMSRNVVFFGLVLIPFSAVNADTVLLLVSLFCTGIFLFDFAVRTTWVEQSFDVVLPAAGQTGVEDDDETLAGGEKGAEPSQEE